MTTYKVFYNINNKLHRLSRMGGAKINLVTMHAAKGLEFDVHFFPGWE